MSQNVQLAAVLMPAGPAPKQAGRPLAQKEDPFSAAENNVTMEASGEPVKTKDKSAPATNVFGRLLNNHIDKQPADEQEEAIPAEILTAPVPAASSYLWEQIMTQQAPTVAAVPIDQNPQPQNAMPAAPFAMVNAAPEPKTPIAPTEPAASQMVQPQPAAKDALSASFNGKQTTEETASDPAKQANTENAHKPTQTGLELAEAKTEKELPAAATGASPKPTDNRPVEKIPTLPEQAVQNTADKPAAFRSAVHATQLQEQPPAPLEVTPQPSQTPSKLHVGLKTAYQTRTDQPAQKPSSILGQTTESAASAHAAAQAQQQILHKGAVALNSPEVKVTGVENESAAGIRAADAVVSSRPAEQIAQSLPPGPVQVDQQIRLTLTPAELGTVRITFREHEGEIVGIVEAQKTQTRKEIEESLPQLVSAMQNQGLQVRRIEVVQWNTPQQGTRDQLSENFNPSTEREFLQQQAGHSNDRSSRNGHSEQPGVFDGQPDKRLTPEADSQQWFSNKGLNLYI